MRVNMPRGCYRGVFSASNLNSPKLGRSRIDESQYENVSSLSRTSRKILTRMKNMIGLKQKVLYRCRNIATANELLLNLGENGQQKCQKRLIF
jgi:hypothetical protein